jgi:hypothetical protein
MVERKADVDKVEKLTRMAESGDKAGLMEELHAMDPAERARVARQMDELNEQRRQSQPQLPDIQIAIAKDAAGAPRLDDILTKVPNDSKAWWKPWTWLESSEITRDVYDPQYDRLGNGLLQKTAETIGYRNRRVNEIIAQMER